MTHRCCAMTTKASQTARFEDFAPQAYLKDMDDSLRATDIVGLCSTINVNMHTEFEKHARNRTRSMTKELNQQCPCC